MPTIETLRVLTLGMTQSGKGVFNQAMFCDRSPRVLHLDVNGEKLKSGGEDILPVSGYADTVALLKTAAKYREWRIAAFLEDPRDIERLFALLLRKDSIAAPSLCEAMGGLVVECGEASVLFPRGRTPAVIRSAPLLGRHRALSLVLGSQRPADCDIAARSQSDVIVLFRLIDDRSLQWVAANVGSALVDRVRRLPPHRGYMWYTHETYARAFDENRRVVERVDLVTPDSTLDTNVPGP